MSDQNPRERKIKQVRFDPETGAAREIVETQHDFIAHGSVEHQKILNVRPVEKGETPAHVHKGYTFADENVAYVLGPATRPEYVQGLLQSAVNELLTPPTVPPGPAMWKPSE